MGTIARLGSLGIRRPEAADAAARAGRPPRLAIYLASTVLAVLTAYFIGKDMGFDTLNYHLYAGFSALHDRLQQDYFPAGPQSYLNPYAYVPFYLLATSGLPGLVAAGLLAIAQSGILWLTFEIALQVCPAETDRARVVLAVCALVLAFANPILIDQFGSSYADVTTAELVLGGWLLLVRAINRPGMVSMACAGLLLGAACALKLTNSVHAVAAIVPALFVPGDRRARRRGLVLFVGCMAVAFVAVSAPWSLRLEHRFGSPLFPLFNGIFHSPEFPDASSLDYRFIPGSVAEALRRPFDTMSPAGLVDVELPAPDARYALLLIMAVASVAIWCFRRSGRPNARRSGPRTRALAALGCGFLLDWTLWLTASGNGRYFIAMACVAAVLIIALAYGALASWPMACKYVFAGIFGLQAMLLTMGAVLVVGVPWDAAPWLRVSIPTSLTVTPALYFIYGEPSNSFIAAFLPRGNGLVSLAGSYVLGPEGANGARIDSLISKYSPHLRLILRDPRRSEDGRVEFPAFAYANDALEDFGFRADPADCTRIAVHDVAPGVGTGYLLTCELVADGAAQSAQMAAKRRVDVVFNRLEDACPRLFLPRRPLTEDYASKRYGLVWARRYPETGLMVLIGDGVVQIADRTRGGPASFVGREGAWATAPLRLRCWRRDGRYYERRVSAAARRSGE